MGFKRLIYITIRCRRCHKRIMASRMQDAGGDNSLHTRYGRDGFKLEDHKIKGFFSPKCKKSGEIIHRRYNER